MVNRDDKAFTVTTFEVKTVLRACLHGGGGPQDGEVTRLGGVTRLSIQSLKWSPHLSCKRDQFKNKRLYGEVGYLTYLESPTSM